jgi:hypothetical protein
MGYFGNSQIVGGWGLKNVFYFSKALAAKFVWRLITTDSLWTKVISHKYISPDSRGMDQKAHKGDLKLFHYLESNYQFLSRW